LAIEIDECGLRLAVVDRPTISNQQSQASFVNRPNPQSSIFNHQSLTPIINRVDAAAIVP